MKAREVCEKGYFAIRNMHADQIRWERECFPSDQWSDAAHRNKIPDADAMLRYAYYYDLLPAHDEVMGVVSPPRMVSVNKRPPPMKTWSREKIENVGKKK